MLLFLSHFDAVFPTINRDEPAFAVLLRSRKVQVWPLAHGRSASATEGVAFALLATLPH